MISVSGRYNSVLFIGYLLVIHVVDELITRYFAIVVSITELNL